jgi:hypothetical protein
MTGAGWVRQLAGIVGLAAVIAVAATLFGNEFAPEATHAEPAAEAEHAEGEEAAEDEHAEEEEEEEEEEHADEEQEDETSAGQVAGAILIVIGGIAVVPLTSSLGRRRLPQHDVAGDVAAAAEADRTANVAVGLALLSIGAAVIHFAVIAQHLDEWWLTGTFFIVVALFQIAWAVAVLARPSRPLYLIGAAVNTLVVITWIVSRTTGVPVGPEAGEPESVGLADVMATVYEVLLVAGASARSLHAPTATAVLRPLAGAPARWLIGAAVAVLTALTLALLP